MDFRLTKEEALFQKMCREFALNEVEPIAAEIDAEERYPEETVQKLMSAAPAVTISAILSLSKR